MKSCPKCKELFEGKQCKFCARARVARWRIANPGKNKEWNKAHPENVKATSLKSRAKPENVIKQKERLAKWRLANPEKAKASSDKWRIENPEKAKAAYKARIKANPPDKKQLKKYNAARYVANKERINAIAAMWAKAHPEAKRISSQNQRARKRANGGKLSKGLTEKLFKLQRGKCTCCGKPLGDDYHLDHRMPLVLGGANEDWNMQLLTSTCNQQKYTKHPIDFMQERGFLL